MAGMGWAGHGRYWGDQGPGWAWAGLDMGRASVGHDLGVGCAWPGMGLFGHVLAEHGLG
jgi:hypothetical protein